MSVKNTCDCHNPPGGRAVCEPTQMAICIVVHGVARMECLDPPRSHSSTVRAKWALGHVTGHRTIIIWEKLTVLAQWILDVFGHKIAVDTEDLRILARGNFIRPGGAIVTFKLPEDIARAVELLVIEGEGEVESVGTVEA